MEIHDARPFWGDQRFRYLECLRVLGIEALRQSTRQFKMLPLVLANRDAVSLVEQNVGSLQYWIGKQAGIRLHLISTS